ncbi:hypothetical protein [Leptospira neocaledonica]|uniref:Lipoprotein n=1 Tax=Leptospira neocaledonica TaxID=2023192 RepID=A0A2M9ZW15_9LEPT|nr:hypothetical protein [Leptospira neocaledonica]PJZ76225.1 hypothetical protein CH365_15505 [Leptospira neocaledonica]
MKRQILIITLFPAIFSCSKGSSPPFSQILSFLGSNAASGQLKLASGETSNLSHGSAYRFKTSFPVTSYKAKPTLKATDSENTDTSLDLENESNTIDLLQGVTEEGWQLVIRTNPSSDSVTGSEIMLSKNSDLYVAKEVCNYFSSKEGLPSVTISDCTLTKISNQEPGTLEDSSTNQKKASEASDTIVLSGVISLSNDWQNLEGTSESEPTSGNGLVNTQDLNDPLCLYSIYALYMEYKLGTEIQALLSQWWNPFALYAAYLKLIQLKFWVIENGKYQSYCWS